MSQGVWGTPRIPVFSSVPSKLSGRQTASRDHIYAGLRSFGLEPRTVEPSGPDLAMRPPLQEVRTLARHCAGGIVLGYVQVVAATVQRPELVKAPTGEMIVRQVTSKGYEAATPWNQLETGILFGLGLPLFVLREDGIEGGIFDTRSAGIIIHRMPMPGPAWNPSRSRAGELKNPAAEESFKQALLRWQSLVSTQYYGSP